MTRATADHPALGVSIELSSELLPHFDANGGMNSALCKAVEDALAKLITELGVPGGASVTVSGQPSRAGKVLRVLVDGRPTRYPDEVLLLKHAYITQQLLHPDVKLAGIVQWLKERCENASAADHDMAVEFLCGSCLEIVKLQPALLLAPAQVKAYAKALGDALSGPSGFTAPDPDLVTTLAGSLLEMGISIANVRAVAEVVARESKSARPPDHVVENLIDALRAGAVEIQLPRPLLQQITTRWEKEGLTALPMLRDGLFVELGIELPPLRFVAIENLKANCFAFKVNHVTSSPLRALGSDQCLINDTVERIGLQNLKGSPVTNPATGQPGSVIDLGEESRAQSLGLTTWNQLQYLVLCLAEFLRRRAWCTVHRGGVKDHLQTVERYFPSLVSSFRSRHTDEELTTVLRALVRDRVSVQNVRVILERWLDYDLLRDGGSTTDSTGDAVLASPVSFARVGLGHEIAHRAARTTNTVVVYLLDAEIEQIASRHSYSQLGSQGDDILRALRSEMAFLPPTAMIPSILTFVEARSTLQRLVSSEFPRMSVIAHEELPPGVNVQPVARISLAS
jgi:flagellar biosynthesis component FlhA